MTADFFFVVGNNASKKPEKHYFLITEGKKKFWQPKILDTVKIHFQNKSKIKNLRWTKLKAFVSNILALQNSKGSPSGSKKIIPDWNKGLHKGMKNIDNFNYISKYVSFFPLKIFLIFLTCLILKVMTD